MAESTSKSSEKSSEQAAAPEKQELAPTHDNDPTETSLEGPDAKVTPESIAKAQAARAGQQG